MDFEWLYQLHGRWWGWGVPTIFLSVPTRHRGAPVVGFRVAASRVIVGFRSVMVRGPVTVSRQPNRAVFERPALVVKLGG